MGVQIKSDKKTYGGVPTHYKVNVAKDGVHLFATADHSITSQGHLDKVMKIFKEKFPESEGYHVMVTAEYAFGITMDEYEIGKRSW